MVEYGSLGPDGVDEVIASWRAILEWQDQGPFESKEAELLPTPLRTAIDQELQWLRDYRATM